MSYVIPSVLVYQILANAGGVANVTPDLNACIIGPCYNVISYDGTSAASLLLSRTTDSLGTPGSITDNQVNNVFTLPSQKVGQDLEESSLQVYVNNAIVETLLTYFDGEAGSNELTMTAATASGEATSASAVLISVDDTSKFSIGDSVTVAGAGTAGGDLVAVILDVDATTITLDTPAVTTDATVTITKNAISNTNQVSSTLRAEAGDTAFITYVTSGLVTKTFSTTIVSVINATGTITDLKVSDILPSDVVTGEVLVSIRKTYNNQLLDGAYYDDSTTGATGEFTITPEPKLVYGTIITTDVYAQYRALRTDLEGTILTIANVDDLEGTLGEPTELNPLALGVQLALANTTTEVQAIAVSSDDLLGHQGALELAENAKVYALVPLTQEDSILTAYQQHVEQLSTPEMASWRTALVNTAIPTTKDIGPYNVDLVNANSGNNAITLVSSSYILTASNATFMTDGVVPGDIVHITAGTGSPSPIGTHQVLEVLSNQQLKIQSNGTATGVSYYITRNLTKAQQAEVVAGVSETFGSKRVVHCPNVAGVIVNGVTKYLPGYYFMCGVAGLIAGLPAQAGLTNIALAGFTDVMKSNFYFTRAQMDTMAAAGTFLVVQESQGSIPYIRHELTTDMTVLQYREIQQVKNIDFLSYYFHDILKGFIGKWNITPDSLNTLRQTINAGGKLLEGKVLPKIGAPLVSFTIKTLKQDEDNADNVIVELPVKIPTVMNYISLYLII